MLFIHILAGIFGLIVAPGALLARKGSAWHRWWGRLYLAAVVVVGATAIVLSVAPLNPFLLLVSFFSMYMAYSGFRHIAHRRTRSIHRMDQVIAVATTIVCVILVFYGGLELLREESFGVVIVTIGGLGVWLAGSDAAFHRNPDFSPATIYVRHLRLMIGSYIAMWSAFSAVNLLFLTPWVRWLWPTLAGTVLITVWSWRIARGYTRWEQVNLRDDILSTRESGMPQ